MNRPTYDVIEFVHVVVAVVAFGSLAATGWYSALIRQRKDPLADAGIVRYFRPGRNWAELAILVVPLLGGALVVMRGSAVADKAWPWIGLGIWTIAVSFATGLVFPAERALQQLIADKDANRTALLEHARRCEFATAVTSLSFVAALVVMIAKP